MHATTIQSQWTVRRGYQTYQPSRSTLVKLEFDRSNAPAEICLWKLRVDSELHAKIEMILLLVLGALGLGATGYGIEHLATFVNSDAMAHAVTALFR
jgi:hypothetical protein